MINGTMIQYFHWYVPADGKFWKELDKNASYLSELGVTAAWLPPAHKGKDGPKSSGYDLYDFYDLGEFDQKGSIRTKYGTKEELISAVQALKANNVQVYADIVLNHMGGADKTEKIMVRRVNEENRNEFLSDPFEIEAYTLFTFPGRKGKYSQFVWDHKCFTGVDYAHDLKETAIFTILNEYGDLWEDVIDDEKGNYDYLMFCDIEFRNPEVREELKRFSGWLLHQIGFDGMRLDAVKHIAPPFMIEFLDNIRALKPDLFAVGEYWAPGDLPLLLRYLDAIGNRMSLFDASLHHNFFEASKSGQEYDLRTILDNSLLRARPENAVTVVENHDTQPLQTLEAPVGLWFKPLAYALILLRQEGYPCVFYADLFGARYSDAGGDGEIVEVVIERTPKLEELMRARKLFAYGEQTDYFASATCIGWTRKGGEESGCAVIISNGDAAALQMDVGKNAAGAVFIDYLQNHTSEVHIDEHGMGQFPVNERSVSVWVDRRARS